MPADRLTADSRARQAPVVQFALGDRLTLTRKHPCGSRTWHVVRLGADIGVACEGCARRVLIERRQLERRLVAIDRGSDEAGP